MSRWETEADNERLRDRLDRRDEDIADLQRVIDEREARIEELEVALRNIEEETTDEMAAGIARVALEEAP